MGRAATNKKHDLITTALELLWQNSYGSVSVDEICKTADVNKGSFYYYFKSKAELAVAALESYNEELKPHYDDVFSPRRSPQERLEKLAEGELAFQREALANFGHVCGCPYMALGSEMANLDDSIRDKVDCMNQDYGRYFQSTLNDLKSEGCLREDDDTQAIAQQISGFILGQLTYARIQNSLIPLEKNLKEGILRLAGVIS